MLMLIGVAGSAPSEQPSAPHTADAVQLAHDTQGSSQTGPLAPFGSFTPPFVERQLQRRAQPPSAPNWVAEGLKVFPVSDKRHVAPTFPKSDSPCGSCKFFVPGVRKAGTTSLYKWIAQHPNVRGVKLDVGIGQVRSSHLSTHSPELTADAGGGAVEWKVRACGSDIINMAAMGSAFESQIC